MATLNALNPTLDINAVVNWVNQAVADGMADVAPEEFHSLQLLDTIRYDANSYVYYRYADEQPIQGKADKLILRRWAPLKAHTIPLSEGVPPKSDKGSVEKYELEARQYGRYMEFSEKVDFKCIDPVIAHYSKEYSMVAMETLNLLARDALLAAAQVYYAGGALSPDEFTFDNAVPKMLDLRMICLSFKRALVLPRANGKYPVIGSAEFYWDLFSDPLVVQYMTINQTTSGTAYDGSPNHNGGSAPLPPMFDMEFIETPHVFESGEYFDSDGNKRLKIYTGTVDDPEIGQSDGDGDPPADLIETNASQYAITSGYDIDPRTGQQASYIPEKETWTLGDGQKEFKMQHIIILGKDALARTGLQGEGQARMYVKKPGTSGVIDPIDQRQSIGFKINSVGFGSTRPEAIYDYICVPTMVNQ